MTKAPAGIPDCDKIFGLTAMIYAMVKNVVRPAIISFLIFTPLLSRIGNNFVKVLDSWFATCINQNTPIIFYINIIWWYKYHYVPKANSIVLNISLLWL